MLYFTTPGHADITALTTMGISAKNEGAIGYFGTGFKYALAVIIRNGGSLTLRVGDTYYAFTTKPTIVRDKPFDIIMLQRNAEPVIPLSFTAQLGRDWEPWMAYRELWSNTKDEGGVVSVTPPPDCAEGNMTCIAVDGLDDVHKKAHEFLLIDPGPRLLKLGAVLEVYERPSKALFYRGIKVHELSKPALFTYNILEPVNLSEDRLLKNTWGVERGIIYALGNGLTQKSHRQLIMSSADETWEGKLPWSELDANRVSEDFKNELLEYARKPFNKLGPNLQALSYRLKPAGAKYGFAKLSPVQQRMLDKAIALLEQNGITTSREIRPVIALDGGHLGLYAEDKIFISLLAFNQGITRLVSTLLEEIIHAEQRYDDYSREFQDFVLDMAVNLMLREAL